MASYILYPPIVDDSLPGYKVITNNGSISTNQNIKVYFRLSKFNISSDFSSVHVSIESQSRGSSVVNKQDSVLRLRRTGVILNVPFVAEPEEGEGVYSITLIYGDFKSTCWSSSSDNIFKIQLRLSPIECNDPENQESWIGTNAGKFSEWSTVCRVKFLHKVNFNVKNPVVKEEQGKLYPVYSNDTLFFSVDCELDSGESVAEINAILYDNEGNILEQQKAYQNDNNNGIYNYRCYFNYRLLPYGSSGIDYPYTLKCFFTTSSLYKEEQDIIFITEYNQADILPLELKTIEDNITDSSLGLEEEEGRVLLKIVENGTMPQDPQILSLVRSDSEDGFTRWNEIKRFVYNSSNNIIYDYTIESGVFYQYGLKTINDDDVPSITYGKTTKDLIIRHFENSFLLGKKDKQLKLAFDNTMGSYRYQINESSMDTIGGKFPVVSRNAATYYQTFPINGLISFKMDDNKLFCSDLDLFKTTIIATSYKNIKKQYDKDIIYERKFRDKVLEFLQDGEIKLFKSPTEGNILVRLMNVNCMPNQQLGRMIYSFSANAVEMGEPTIENYIKYNILNIEDIKQKDPIPVENNHIHNLPKDFKTPDLGIKKEAENE